jgi:hypothetical protein
MRNEELEKTYVKKYKYYIFLTDFFQHIQALYGQRRDHQIFEHNKIIEQLN